MSIPSFPVYIHMYVVYLVVGDKLYVRCIFTRVGRYSTLLYLKGPLYVSDITLGTP